VSDEIGRTTGRGSQPAHVLANSAFTGAIRPRVGMEQR
jgi:hypothetical protein